MSEQLMNKDEKTPTTSSNYLGMNTGEPDITATTTSTSSIARSMPMEHETTARLSFSIKFQ